MGLAELTDTEKCLGARCPMTKSELSFVNYLSSEMHHVVSGFMVCVVMTMCQVTCILWSFGLMIQQCRASLPPLHFEIQELLIHSCFSLNVGGFPDITGFHFLF